MNEDDEVDRHGGGKEEGTSKDVEKRGDNADPAAAAAAELRHVTATLLTFHALDCF
jgi:hypothetical protein